MSQIMPARIFSLMLAVGLTACAGTQAAMQADAADASVPAPFADLVSEGPGANAPEQLRHFAPLIGQWTMTSETLNSEGEWTASEGPDADWNFHYALDGQAIADVWTAPPRDVAVEPPAQRQVGINLRIYWPGRDEWEMAWVSPGWGYIMLFTAQSDDDQIVMNSVGETPQGALSRVTFYNLTGDSFDWRSEQSTDDGATWAEVFRLHGERR